jgi:AraC family transcriptional regulator of adaptative response/methylated-DNA-[protein]-cysteine methyltransferase
MINNKDYRRIEQAIDWIRANYSRQPAVAEMAAAVHLSPFHFSRMFRDWAGISPHQYLRVVTLQAAKRRLASESGTLAAALDVGLSGTGRLHDLFVTIEAMSPGEYQGAGRDLEIRYGHGDSPFGGCGIATTRRGICALEFGDIEPGALRRRWPRATVIADGAGARALLGRIFDDGGPDALRLHLKGSNFQFQVWRALLKIAPGQTVSYGQLAAAIGRPGAARAVGQAVGSNPVAYLIPCHRVLRGDGEIGGYRWGPSRKSAMLAREASRQFASV